MQGAALVAAGLSKAFGPKVALDAVSLSLAAGERVALIGPSGSGKSTLLRMCAGLVLADAGSVSLEGVIVQAEGRYGPDVRHARARIGFVFQQFNLVGRLDALTNVLIGALARLERGPAALGAWPAEEQRRAMIALDRVGVVDLARRRVSTLSGGQQQRVAIARALHQGAKVLFADEPIASLDPVSARKTMTLLAELNAREGLTLLVSLHQVDYAIRYCERIVALKEGRLVYDGPAAGLDRERLVDIYGAEIEEAFWQEP
jgi:phosphonate transport system ATP-binding protein